MDITLVLNRKAGTLRGKDAKGIAADIASVLQAHGHKVEVAVRSGHAAIEAITRVCREGSCDAVIVGGGDGTVSAAAAVAADSQVALGVLPLGTMNLFARSLGIPLELNAAVEALATATRSSVDIGQVNGRYFVHHVTLGLHPRLIRARENLSYGSRLGKIWASTQAWWIVLRQPPRLSVRLAIDGQKFDRKTAAVLVSNNPLGDGHLPYADDLKQGRMGVYVAKARRWPDLLQLTAQITFGTIRDTPLLESWMAESVTIGLPDDRATASVDGELIRLETPLRISVCKRGLAVLRPKQA
jgi:diacylglycerol kinase family enzyme